MECARLIALFAITIILVKTTTFCGRAGYDHLEEEQELDDEDKETDTDSQIDECPQDDLKSFPGECGCGVSDEDTDGDGLVDCKDNCPNDANKLEPGQCGCGVPDVDTDNDGICNSVDVDDDGDGWPDGEEVICGSNPILYSSVPLDSDGDDVCDGADICVGDDTLDNDADGTPDCADECPFDYGKTDVGLCGCGVTEGTCKNVMTVYQAEDCSSSYQCSFAAGSSGWTGNGFMDFALASGSWLEWNNIKVFMTEPMELVFRYALHWLNSNRPFDVIVNGQKVFTLTFEGTGGWDIWGTESIMVPLTVGDNVIRIISNTDRGGPNLDKMTVVPTTDF